MPPRRVPARPRARSTKTYLFSYGSNSPRQLAERLGHPVQGRAAFVEGYLRAFRGWSQRWEGGVATLIPGRGKTYGYIAEVAPADLAVLDRYEGVATGNYYRETMTVTTDDGDTVQAIAYLASSTEKNAPSRAYKRAVAETIGAFWEGSNGPVTEEDITVRNNPRGKVKRFGKPLPFHLPAQARNLFDARTQTLTVSTEIYEALIEVTGLPTKAEMKGLTRRERAYVEAMSNAQRRGGRVVIPMTRSAAFYLLAEEGPIDIAMDIASGSVGVVAERYWAKSRADFHMLKQVSEALYRAYVFPYVTVNPHPHRRNPASNLFYHATLAGKNGEVLASLAEGIDPSRAKGFGQGAGFYLWANRDRALRHLADVASGEGLTKEVAVAGEPILVVLDVPLTPEDFDIDYEVYAEGLMHFLRDNAAWFTANAERLVFPFSVYDDGEFADASFKFTGTGLMWRIGNRRKGMSFDSDMRDTGDARLLSAFARRLSEVAPDMFRRFEAEMLPRASAVKYVGARVQPLRIERPDGTTLWKRGDAIPRRTNPLTRRNSRF
jgi:cation transport regulator ChaC